MTEARELVDILNDLRSSADAKTLTLLAELDAAFVDMDQTTYNEAFEEGYDKAMLEHGISMEPQGDNTYKRTIFCFSDGSMVV